MSNHQSSPGRSIVYILIGVIIFGLVYWFAVKYWGPQSLNKPENIVAIEKTLARGCFTINIETEKNPSYLKICIEGD